MTPMAMINGTTITLYGASELDELEFFHIKLELHDLIYAEGAPCETLGTVDENAVNFAEDSRQYGPPMIEDNRCASWVGFGRRIEIKSRFRSAISPWIDRRQRLDIIRDKLGERGIAFFPTIGTRLTSGSFGSPDLEKAGVLLIAALFIFYGLYQGIFRAVGKAFAADFVPHELRASGVGWYSTTVGLLQLVASVVAGLLWDRVGHAAVFFYGALFATAGGIGLLMLVPAHPANGRSA